MHIAAREKGNRNAWKGEIYLMDFMFVPFYNLFSYLPVVDEVTLDFYPQGSVILN